jgi:hypothetical protein
MARGLLATLQHHRHPLLAIIPELFMKLEFSNYGTHQTCLHRRRQHARRRHNGIGQLVIAQNDALGVLFLGSPEAVGVSIVCGTGAATGARATDGRIWHSSYWQDEWHGSTHLGQKALLAVYRAKLT